MQPHMPSQLDIGVKQQHQVAAQPGLADHWFQLPPAQRLSVSACADRQRYAIVVREQLAYMQH
jgi:hypothetical protein